MSKSGNIFFAITTDLDAVKVSGLSLLKDWDASSGVWNNLCTNDGSTFVANIEAMALDVVIGMLDLADEVESIPILKSIARYSPILGLAASLHSTANDIQEASESANQHLGSATALGYSLELIGDLIVDLGNAINLFGQFEIGNSGDSMHNRAVNSVYCPRNSPAAVLRARPLVQCDEPRSIYRNRIAG